MFGVFSAPSQAALVAHWTFDNEAGGTVPDVTGNGLDGTLINGASLIPDSPFGGGQSLATGNGGGTENQAVDIPGSASLGANPFTLAYWIKPTTDQASIAGLERITSRAGDAFETAIGDASAVGGTTSPTGLTLSYYQGVWHVTNVPITVDEWTHVAWVNTAANMELFVNGASAFTGPTVAGTRPGTGFMRIGTRHNNVEGFEGYVDDLRLYDQALSAPEVAQLAEVIPEPSSIVLSVIGLLGCAALRRRRRRS